MELWPNFPNQEKLNQDHLKIESLFKSVQSEMESGDLDRIRAVFFNALDYLTKHFNREEDLMYSINYPLASQHADSHFKLQELYLSLAHPVLDGNAPGELVSDFMSKIYDHGHSHDLHLSMFLEETEG
jgi:hemerythrin-like metal-binding protein